MYRPVASDLLKMWNDDRSHLRADDISTTKSEPENTGLTLDEIIGCIGILSILGLIAVCLVYFCLRKYCCLTGGERLLGIQRMEVMQQASVSSGSFNHNSLPSIQKAVNGSHSPISSSDSPDGGRHRRRALSPRKRVQSPGQRLTGPLNVETVRSPRLQRQSSVYQRAALRQSQLGSTTSRISNRPRVESSQTRRRAAQDNPLAPPNGAMLTASQPVKSASKSQGQDSFVPTTTTTPLQTIDLNDVPITAEMISNQTKDSKKEFLLFKSPNLYD